MAIIQKLPITVLLCLLISSQTTLSTVPPSNSPSPSPSLIISPPQSSPPSPVPSPNESSADDDPPAPSPDNSPVPGPEKEGEETVKDVKAGSEEREKGGMSGGKKAGIALGVIGAACLVGVGGFVYNKRQQNLRRSEYSYGARRDML